ncbi:ABC transporter permease [Aminipila terrae]|uniref:ABC transporter permease n=1 Tax=Aminipila terrae TaxID=2697030 RepID=UPI002ED2E1A4
MSENMQRRPGPMGGHQGMGATVEKSQDFKGTWGKLIKYCKGYLPIMVFALLTAAAGTVLQIIGPDKLKDMTNEITKGLPALINGHMITGVINMDAVVHTAVLLVFFYASATLLNFTQSFIMASVTQKISKTMRTDISQKINRLPLGYFDKTSYGDVLSRVTNDVDAIGQTMNQSIGTLVTSVTMFIGSLIMMFYTNWILALTAVFASVVGFTLMIVIMKKSQKYFSAQQKGLGNVNGYIEEIYSGHNIVKAYNGSRNAKKNFEEINEGLYDSAWKSQFLSGLMMPIMQFIGNFGYVAVCVVGAVLAMKGTISFGVIVAFMMYIRLFTQPLSQMAQAANNLQRTAAAGERVFEFLEEEEMDNENQKIKLCRM